MAKLSDLKDKLGGVGELSWLKDLLAVIALIKELFFYVIDAAKDKEVKDAIREKSKAKTKEEKSLARAKLATALTKMRDTSR